MKEASSKQHLLNEAKRLAIPVQEETFFSIGGRGYYENPTSDVLAFFLRADAQHGLGNLFLEGLFDSMTWPLDEGKERPENFDNLSVEREVKTSKGSRIDLLLQSSSWLMVIENKIYHHQNNPFEDYTHHVEDFPGERPIFRIILSPEGKSASDRWQGVSYRALIQNLKTRLDELEQRASSSKWLVFARELIAHLENELYEQPMNKDQICLVEKNLIEIRELKNLDAKYREFLKQEIQQVMHQHANGDKISIWDESWALRCRSESWRPSNIAWWYSDKREMQLRISLYLHNPSREEVTDFQDIISPHAKWTFWAEGAWKCWKTTEGIKSREDGLALVGQLAGILNQRFRVPEIPEEPTHS